MALDFIQNPRGFQSVGSVTGFKLVCEMKLKVVVDLSAVTDVNTLNS